MAYDQLWGELSPGHFTFLIDLSGSMENKIAGKQNRLYYRCFDGYI